MTMLTDKSKQWIKKLVENEMLKENLNVNLNEIISVFDKSLEIKSAEDVKDIGILMKKALDNASEHPYDGLMASNLVLIEQYCKHIYCIVNNIDNLDPANMLSYYMRDGLNIIPISSTKSLNDPKWDTYPIPEKYYRFAYIHRNEKGHEAKTIPYAETLPFVMRILCSYLYIAKKFQSVIIKTWNAQHALEAIDSKKYFSDISKENKLIKDKYVDLQWERFSNNDDNVIMASQYNSFICEKIKLVGRAGTGKTYFLKSLETNIANKKTGYIPVYIHLAYVNDNGDEALKKAICERLNISTEEFYNIIETNAVVLLLDGYDEIRDLKVKRAVSKHIDVLITNYPKLTIVVTDRAGIYSDVSLNHSFKVFKPKKMNKSDYRSFINKYAEDNCKSQLLNKLENDMHYFDNNASPIRLCRIITLANYKGNVSDDLTRDYVEYLLMREKEEKKNNLVESVYYFLMALSSLEGSPWSRAKILRLFASVRQSLGLVSTDTTECLQLICELGFLICVNEDENDSAIRITEKYAFESKEMESFFQMLSIENSFEEEIEDALIENL